MAVLIWVFFQIQSPDGSQNGYTLLTLGGEKATIYPHSRSSEWPRQPGGYGQNLCRAYPGTLFGPGGGADIAVNHTLNATGTGIIGSMRLGGTGADSVNVSDMQEGGSINLSSTCAFMAMIHVVK